MKMKVIEEEPTIQIMEGEWSPRSVIRDIVESGTQEDPFYVMDLGEVVARYQRWKELMPRVEPFYAVKCNNDKLLLSTLAALGTGFDCASKNEIELITSIGVEPERIIFANPAKLSSHIRYASANHVDTMTFDSEPELMKLRQIMPHAKLVVRVRCDASSAQCPLGIKFGCEPGDARRLLKLAALLNLQVVGVSFHVGSGAAEFGVFARAIQICRALFDFGRTLGFDMNLLDLGGGFPGGSNTDLQEVASVINTSLEVHFPERSVKVIAEPGRYFACAAYTLAAQVYATRHVRRCNDEGVEEDHTMYFINDGVYGSFNCVLYDHQQVTAEPLYQEAGGRGPCSVWGPSCDGLDCVLPRARLPRLLAGDWLLFADMGAYTLPVASPFNGFPVPAVRHVIAGELASVLQELRPRRPFATILPPAPPPPPPPPPRARRSLPATHYRPSLR